jgi:hypothetical protein
MPDHLRHRAEPGASVGSDHPATVVAESPRIVDGYQAAAGKFEIMTHEELIQRAIEHLKENKVTKETLSSPRVREVKVAFIWFKIRDHSNCRLMLDTGELLGREFSTEPLLHEYFYHCRLPREAHMLAREIQNGDWDRFPAGGTEPAPVHDELIKELEHRCPGWSKVEYEQALTDSLSKLKCDKTT